MFNATFNNISVISWRSILLVEKTTDLSQVTDKLYQIMMYTSPWSRFELTTSVAIGTDYIGSCTSNNHRHRSPGKISNCCVSAKHVVLSIKGQSRVCLIKWSRTSIRILLCRWASIQSITILPKCNLFSPSYSRKIAQKNIFL